MNIPILFIDDDLLVIDKPSGVSSTRGGYNQGIPSLQGELEPMYGRLWLVHRLDRDTSGVMLLARNAKSHRTLNLEFDHKEIKKTYLALILGIPEWNEYTCDLPLRVNADRAHRTRIDDAGKTAETFFEVIQPFNDACLIQAKPRTGLTHQIRAHLSGLGYPILMDDLYMPTNKSMLSQSLTQRTRIDTLLSRTALHASQLEFTHPSIKKPILLQAPLPMDMTQTIDALVTYLK